MESGSSSSGNVPNVPLRASIQDLLAGEIQHQLLNPEAQNIPEQQILTAGPAPGYREIFERVRRLNFAGNTLDPSCLSVTKRINTIDENLDDSLLSNLVDNIEKPSLPVINIPERIILVVDKAADSSIQLPFKSMRGGQYTSFFMLQEAVKIFVYNKSYINSKHKFALMFLEEKEPVWNCSSFKGSSEEIIKLLAYSQSCCTVKEGEIFFLDKVLTEIGKKVRVYDDDSESLPPYVVRVILLLSRSIEDFDLNQKVCEMLKSPYFFMDVLISHDENNRNPYIYNKFCQIDYKGTSHVYSVGQNINKLYEATAKLLSHPLQRPLQPCELPSRKRKTFMRLNA